MPQFIDFGRIRWHSRSTNLLALFTRRVFVLHWFKRRKKPVFLPEFLRALIVLNLKNLFSIIFSWRKNSEGVVEMRRMPKRPSCSQNFRSLLRNSGEPWETRNVPFLKDNSITNYHFSIMLLFPLNFHASSAFSLQRKQIVPGEL